MRIGDITNLPGSGRDGSIYTTDCGLCRSPRRCGWGGIVPDVQVKVEKCAGIDVGKKFLAVCVLIGLAKQKPVGEVRRFGTSVKELERLRAWLLESGCTEAVMESTGSYWKPVFNILEGSLKIILANPEQVKALRGKKTEGV